MHGACPVPAVWGTLVAGRTTRVLRNADEPAVDLESASDYRRVMESAGIDYRVESRRQGIWEAAQAVASGLGTIPESAKGDLLKEVSNLVESPTVGELRRTPGDMGQALGGAEHPGPPWVRDAGRCRPQ